MADCLGQGVVDILRFADRSSFGPSWLPLQSGPPQPCNLSQTELGCSSRRPPNPAFYPLFMIDCCSRSYVGGISLVVIQLEWAVLCIHSGRGGVGWPAWHSPLPVVRLLASLDRLACATRRRWPGAFQPTETASSSQVTQESCPHFSAASSRPASRSHQVSCFTNSPNLRFPRNSLGSALRTATW